jgi:hypothetical protein
VKQSLMDREQLREPGSTSGSAPPWKDALLQAYCRLLVLVYAFILYALTLGPLYRSWYDSEHGESSKLLAVVYHPLLWATHKFEPLGKLMQWYLSLWI